MGPKVERTLSFYSKGDESLAGEHRLAGINVDELRALFGAPPELPEVPRDAVGGDAVPAGGHPEALPADPGRAVDLAGGADAGGAAGRAGDGHAVPGGPRGDPCPGRPAHASGDRARRVAEH